MILEITPKMKIGKKSIRLGKNFLGKNQSRNCFISMLSERDNIFSTWFINDGQYKLISNNSEKRCASKLEKPLQYRLTTTGVDFFHKIYNEFGTFHFAFLSDTELYPSIIGEYLKIEDLKPNLVLKINKLILIND
jgi:hypothetical protein